MARKRALSAREVDALMNKLGTHRVDENLYLQVREDGTRSWAFRYSRGGRMRSLGLGAARHLPYAEARQLAAEYRLNLWRGVDISAEHRSRRAQVRVTSSAPTFGWCAGEYVAKHESSWKSQVHRRQWVQTLDDYAAPVIGKTPVDEVGVDEVLRVLEPLWTTKPETAGRLRGRIARVLGWATAMGYRSGDNPAALGGPLDHLLPPLAKFQKVKHHASVPHAELPDLVMKIGGLGSTSAKALLLTIITAVRTSETLGATWDEFDLKERLWRIPAERMKAAREHWVPLADEAVALLEALPGRKGLIFPGARKGRPLSNMAMMQCLRGLRDDGATVHGFRATFSTWARERTDFAHEVIEAALAHGHESKVVGAYARTSYLDKRTMLMQAWADHAYSASSPKAR